MIGRRDFLCGATALAAAGPGLAVPAAAAGPRAVSFINLHTDERLTVAYHDGTRYDPVALGKIDRILRDFRTNDVHPIDPRLIDLLVRLGRTLDTRQPFGIVSGFRSARTNAWLAARSGGVATHSLHLDGRAIDIRLAGVPVGRVYRAARSLQAGGAGLYTRSDFVHIDTGRPRFWGG